MSVKINFDVMPVPAMELHHSQTKDKHVRLLIDYHRSIFLFQKSELTHNVIFPKFNFVALSQSSSDIFLLFMLVFVKMSSKLLSR